MSERDADISKGRDKAPKKRRRLREFLAACFTDGVLSVPLAQLLLAGGITTAIGLGTANLVLERNEEPRSNIQSTLEPPAGSSPLPPEKKKTSVQAPAQAQVKKTDGDTALPAPTPERKETVKKKEIQQVIKELTEKISSRQRVHTQLSEVAQYESFDRKKALDALFKAFRARGPHFFSARAPKEGQDFIQDVYRFAERSDQHFEDLVNSIEHGLKEEESEDLELSFKKASLTELKNRLVHAYSSEFVDQLDIAKKPESNNIKRRAIVVMRTIIKKLKALGEDTTANENDLRKVE